MVIKMISYEPFYETLFKKGVTEYNLIFKQGFSANTFHRMKKGEAINTKTLDVKKSPVGLFFYCLTTLTFCEGCLMISSLLVGGNRLLSVL